MPLVIVILGIVLLLVLILGFKLNSFLAFVIVSLGVALAEGMTLEAAIKSLEQGIGNTLGILVMILGLGAMLGKLVADSGAALRITSSLIGLFGQPAGIITTAAQVESLTQKKIKVVPSRTIPQGVVALLAFDYEADFNANADIMEKALSTVRTIEVTRAVRATKINGMSIKKHQPIGLLDDELVATGEDDMDVINTILGKIDLDNAEVITIYYGADTLTGSAEEVSASITEQYPSVQVELIKGNQPHYNYILSVE